MTGPFARLRRVWALLSDPRTPRLPKAAVVLALAYLVWPADLVPDFVVPVIGYLDDLALVWAATRWLTRSGDRLAAAPPGSTGRSGPA